MTPDDPRHGTNAGYRAHRVAGQDACDDCKRAAATYQAQRSYDAMQGRDRLVDATGTIRRIQALYAIGWTSTLIGDAAKMSRKQVTNLSSGQTARVRPTTAAKIETAYRALSMTAGPSSYNRVAASRKGWPPPLAWDDIDRDAGPTGWDREDRGCGTRYGYTRHWLAGEEACRPCKDAHAAHARAKRGVSRIRARHSCPRCGVVRIARSGVALCDDCRMAGAA